jgi:diacylglycerol kinase (ATP)
METDTSNRSPFKGVTGFKRIISAAGYSIAGLNAAWTYEAAFRQVCALAILGFFSISQLSLPIWAIALILQSHLLSIVVELINSAIEAAVDHTSLERHPLAKRAKDMGSAAQFVGLANIIVMWSIAIFIA